MRPVLSMLVLLLALQVSARGEEQAPADLSFGWPLPSRATVKQTSVKGVDRIEMRYRIELSEAGEELRLSTDRLELLSAGGVDMTGPARKAAAARQAAQLQTAFPRLRIARSGELLGVEDWEAHVDRCVELLKQAVPADQAGTAEGMRRLMLDPSYRSQLELKAGEHWQLWVTVWIGLAVAPGAPQAATTQVPIGATLVRRCWRATQRGKPCAACWST